MTRPIETIEILGIPVAQVDYEGAIGQLAAWVADPSERTTRSVVAANVHVLTEAALVPAYREAILSADLVLPDGMPLVWAGQMLGGRIRSRCYGPTLMRKAFAALHDCDVSHYLYGTTKPNIEKLVQVIERQWPGTKIAGFAAPPFGPLDEETELANISLINASGAQILWLGIGCPKQELWMAHFRNHLRVRAVLGVGAAFDFISGAKPQAPAWLGNHGLEWLYRLLTEPRRLWRRYVFRNPLFLLLFSRQLLCSRTPWIGKSWGHNAKRHSCQRS
ncbi:MAG: WecB/TagA/CpsF family glycosyltransferase [Kiritimatiellia bacterium]